MTDGWFRRNFRKNDLPKLLRRKEQIKELIEQMGKDDPDFIL